LAGGGARLEAAATGRQDACPTRPDGHAPRFPKDGGGAKGFTRAKTYFEKQG